MMMIRGVRHRRRCTTPCGWAFLGGDGSGLVATGHWPPAMQMQSKKSADRPRFQPYRRQAYHRG